MKNVIVTTIVAGLFTVASAKAQPASRPLVSDDMQSLHTNNRYINKIHVKAVRDFLKRNKEAIHPEWMAVETGFVVKYTDRNNSNCRTVYNSRGGFSYTIRQCYENKMPRDVRALVKSQYYDYTITLVEEIEEWSKPLVYVVHLEDATTLKNVRVVDREIDVLEEYKKVLPGK